MDERVKFIARLRDGEAMSRLCEEFSISRKTGYKILKRYRDCGVEGLTDRSRRPYRHAVTTCGRICLNRKKINLSQVFAGQMLGIKQVDEHIWLVSFMHYDLGYFDDEMCRLEPIANPFGPKVLPMSPE